MWGAIIGDIVGKPYEWHPYKAKDFELFSERSKFTDDTVMTLAVAHALLNTLGGSDAEILAELMCTLRLWGRAFPHRGYGSMFGAWRYAEDPEPYNSFGNGSAMRVSAAGHLANSLAETRRLARLSAAVTHNHPEGIKGAESVASAIYLARQGRSKEEIRSYLAAEFQYDLKRTCDLIRPHYHFDVTCQGSVPEAIIAFLDSEDFEDAIRNAVSLGGDADTQAAIAGSIAEAYYGVPAILKNKAEEMLPPEMLHVLNRFTAVCARQK